jgi:23S rRNA (pseudouridine1915-N3)-methyltransferase
MRIFLYYIGKPRDEHANAMAEEYIRRASRYARVEMREIQTTRFDPWEKHSSAAKILFDPAGKAMNSQQFAQLIATGEREGRDLVFLVGGASGLPDSWRDRGGRLVSLSALTFPHELARVLAAEQIYRAFTMLRGHPYPK